jgi:UDP-N-acetyl-D-mannosaminuronic acid dehydrogenase
MHYMGDIHINPKFYVDLCLDYAKYIQAIIFPAKKCIIVDLDNTLWGGIIGESGVKSIHLGPTLEGRALEELHFLPQIIGGFDEVAQNRAIKIFDRITEKTISVSSPETAEVIKLVDNTYRDVQFAFGNEVASVCNVLEGVNAGEVIRLGKLGYPRTSVASPGLVGGPCLSKDPHILNQSAQVHGITMSITESARNINESMPMITAKFISEKLKFNTKPIITIAGFAFKGEPETDDLRGSMSIEVMNAIQNIMPNSKINIYDPIVKIKDLQKISEHCFTNFNDSILDSDVIVICNNHEFFSSNDLRAMLAKNQKIKLVYDFWNHFDHLDISQKKELNYVTYGSHWLVNKGIDI